MTNRTKEITALLLCTTYFRITQEHETWNIIRLRSLAFVNSACFLSIDFFHNSFSLEKINVEYLKLGSLRLYVLWSNMFHFMFLFYSYDSRFSWSYISWFSLKNKNVNAVLLFSIFSRYVNKDFFFSTSL